MATENKSPPEGFSKPDLDGDSNDSEASELAPGEDLAGILLNIQTAEDGYSWYRLKIKPLDGGDTVHLFAEDDVKTAITKGALEEGNRFWMHKHTETEVYTDDDGEDHEYHPVEVRIE